MSIPRFTPLLTVEEFQSLPGSDTEIQELVAGRIVSEPLPSSWHGRIASGIGMLIGAFARPRRLGVTMTNDSGFILERNPDTLRGPDVSFVSRERYTQHMSTNEKRVFAGAPDLCVEVLSPSNSRAAIHAKVADYLAAGTRIVWVVDCDEERVDVYRTLLSPRSFRRGDELSGEDVIPGLEIPVDEIFEVY